MATLPSASLTINESAGSFAAGTDYLVVMSCVAQNADSVPRVMASTQDILSTYLYSPGASYAARHFLKTRKPVIFVGLPIATPGAVGRQNTSGNTGSSAVSASAGGSGCLEETNSSVTVVTGGTIGTDQIVFDLSCDGGRSKQRVRLGTNNSYAIPNLGITLNFGAGTLVAGDVCLTFTTTAPMWGSTAITLARQNLAALSSLARSWLVIGDLPNSTFAGYILTEINNYETANQRFEYARGQVSDRTPLAAKSAVTVKMTGAPNLTFDGTGHTITRNSGSWTADGFVNGDDITIAGSVSNNGTVGPITVTSATVLTLGSGLVNEGPVANVSVTGGEVLTFAAAGHTITRSGAAGNWLNDGFAVGDVLTIAGSASNNGTTPAVTAVTATVLTFGSGMVNETVAGAGVTITKGQTMSQWVSAQTAAFASIDASKRIDLGLGRARVQCPINGWLLRRPAAWAASEREYQHALMVPTYRKSDGPLADWDMTDGNGTICEFDERTVGGGLAGRFTCLRSYNSPKGAFVALSLTRDTEGLLLSRTHNMAVANLAETIVQEETENAIGQVLVLNADGTGTDASLSLIEQRVNSVLERELLVPGDEGQLASKAVWAASRTDVLNTAGAALHGVLDLELDGTLEQINTTVRVS